MEAVGRGSPIPAEEKGIRMRGHTSWRFGQMLLLIAVIAIGLAGLASTFAPPDTPVALASVAQGNGNDEDEEDRTLEGDVIAIDKSKDPPEMIVANVDGEVIVKMLKTDEIDINDVRPGDYVSVDGEKIHELLFEATSIDVRRRAGR
jgi:hypothetical protein